jgi:YesN/AraC family two-component response regulator
VLKKTKELNSETQVIILTGFGDMDSAIEALRSQADDFLLKPCESQEMLFRVKNCLEKQELTRKLNLYQKILPMCCVCKKIRDEAGRQSGTGEWISIEQFIHEKANLDITSSYCPDCAQKTMDGNSPIKLKFLYKASGCGLRVTCCVLRGAGCALGRGKLSGEGGSSVI